MTDEQTHTQIQYILLIDRLDALEDFRRRLRAKAVKLGGQLGKSRRTVEGDFLPFKRHSLT